MTKEELIDLKWALIDGEWIIYKSELIEWRKFHLMPTCPVCKHKESGNRDIINIRNEGNIKRGNCGYCGATLVIMDDTKKG